MADRFVLSTPEPSQLTRLAEILVAAFAQDPLTLAGLPGVSHADQLAWAEQGLQHLRAPPGCRAELVCATKKETGEIVGFAQWAIPLDSDPGASLAPASAPGSQPPRRPFPAKANIQVWKEFIEGVMRCEQEVMGETKHWSTLALPPRPGPAPYSFDPTALVRIGTDPAFARQGVGRALLQWGVDRAAATNTPIFILASEPGEKLYSAVGFSKREPQYLSSARILMIPMLKEPESRANSACN
jgi:GNAT superfamily N-acetyltransferase